MKKKTRGIPICPKCKKPTVRTEMGSSTTTMYFPPVYNEKGKNTNPDRNEVKSHWHCHGCNSGYAT